VKNYSTPIWSRVLALLELLGTALVMSQLLARACEIIILCVGPLCVVVGGGMDVFVSPVCYDGYFVHCCDYLTSPLFCLKRVIVCVIADVQQRVSRSHSISL